MRWEPSRLPPHVLAAAVERALAEDLGQAGDLTTTAVVPEDAVVEAVMVPRAEGILAGLPVAAAVFRQLDPRISFVPLAAEGALVRAGQPVARIHGPARSVLTGERTALNFVQHLSGVATLTRAFVDRCAGTRARVVDTRKTLPGLRALEKYAVATGGGTNYRFGLDDGILIKDNHIAVAGSIGEAIRRARSVTGPHLRIAVEADTLEQAEEALTAGADHILLDNMDLADLRAAVRLCAGRATTEASGGITLDNVREVAETGVDFISIGRLTHSAPALDLGMDVILGTAVTARAGSPPTGSPGGGRPPRSPEPPG